MTEKRFENRLDKSNVKFNTLNPTWDNEKETGLNVFEMIDELNNLSEENEQLKKDRNELFIRERDARNDWRKLKYENEELKRELDEFKQPNCKKCMHYSKDSAGTYCMCENGLLNGAWEMFPFKWDYTNAKNCKEYEE